MADAVAELGRCRAAGVRLVVDAMPVAAGRDVVRLAEIAAATGVDIVAATGLHHDRYYGPLHWSNRVAPEVLAELFVADLTVGVDRFDYTSPVVERTEFRAGIVKVATDGPALADRDRRCLEAVATASVRTGAPVLTHCEEGRGAVEQVVALTQHGVPAEAIILSHVDKARDVAYALEVAATGAYLELDQNLRQAPEGAQAHCLTVVEELVGHGHGAQIVLGTDGARRSLWTELGGSPGLAWLASGFAALLTQRGLGDGLAAFFHDNPVRALTWRDPGVMAT